jgi:hypothetical protein
MFSIFPSWTGKLGEPTVIKRWMSYLVEMPVAEYSSKHNPELKVVLHHGRYKLLTSGAIYSFGDLYSNYRKCFDRIDWRKQKIDSCLLLGLGLASIPDMLVNRYKQKEIRFTAVEIDELIIQLAMQYVLRPKHIPVQVFTADATSFIQWHHGHYDMICSDVFIGDRIPADLQTEEALYTLKSMLKPGGLLLYNRLSRYQPDIKTNLKFHEDVFSRVFPEGGYLDVEGNWMFVNRLEAFQRT